MTQREDELAVDYSAEVEEDDRTDAENINKASNMVMRKLREYTKSGMNVREIVLKVSSWLLYPPSLFCNCKLQTESHPHTTPFDEETGHC